jgi:tetratricopeptide (TPR) repeat protein
VDRVWAGLLWAMVVFAGARCALAAAASPLVARLGSDAVEERRAAAEALAALGSKAPDATTDIASQLEELRRDEGSGVAGVLNEIRPRAGAEADLVELLVAQRPTRAVEHAIATLCLVRALGRIGTTPAIRELVSVASDAGGAFRPELLRELKRLDEHATAALIEARSDSSPLVRGWAKDVLDALGKRTPGDAVQTTDDQVISDVLRAYALTRDPDALAVVLSFVNSERAQVRAVAREATLAYGEDALGRLRATMVALTGARLPEDADAASAARHLFEAYDHQRLHDVYGRLEEGLASLARGEIDPAVATFDEVLARQPMIDRRAEMVPAFLRLADRLERTDPRRALEYLRKALRIDDGGPSSSHVRGEIQFLEGEELVARGIADPLPFEQALALDPSNEHARARLESLRAGTTARRRREVLLANAVGAVGLALVTIGLFGAMRSRRRRFRS